jgi:tetratricopeptide (TPR) repeat protein
MLILRAVVDAQPTLAEAHYHLGEAYLRLQRVPDAEKELSEANRLQEEETKLGLTVDPKLQARVQTSLGKVRELIKNGAR